MHGSGAATQLFHEESHGALELEVTVRSDLGWRRLPNPSTAYDFGDGGQQRQFMTDAAARIGADELRSFKSAGGGAIEVTQADAPLGLGPGGASHALAHVPIRVAPQSRARCT